MDGWMDGSDDDKPRWWKHHGTTRFLFFIVCNTTCSLVAISYFTNAGVCDYLRVEMRPLIVGRVFYARLDPTDFSLKNTRTRLEDETDVLASQLAG